MVRRFRVETRGQGLYEITAKVQTVLDDSGIDDPSAKHDLERWIARLVPEGDPFYTHDTDGPDDMPAHIRAASSSARELVLHIGN
jgi:thiamine phosphate synthase YjbQ (UPF0047 family)